MKKQLQLYLDQLLFLLVRAEDGAELSAKYDMRPFRHTSCVCLLHQIISLPFFKSKYNTPKLNIPSLMLTP